MPRRSELTCPGCGKSAEQAAVVGRTTAVKRGVRRIYQVLRCPCGRIYRGYLMEEKELPARANG